MSVLLSSEKDPKDFSDNELATEWANVQELEEQFKLPLSAIREEILHRMQEKGLNHIITKDYVIKKQTRGNYGKVSLDWARDNQAVKVVEQLDTGRLNQLRDAGVKIPNYTEIEFVKVYIRDEEI